jgi:hypothetical protein
MLFNIIYNFLALTGSVWILHDLGKLFMPTITNNITNKIRDFVLWQGLKVYTLLENRYHLCIKKGKMFLDNYFDTNKENVHYIHNGSVIKSCYSNELGVGGNINVPECDFILQFLKVNREDTDKYDYNIIRFNNYKDLVEYNTTTNKNDKTSPVKFLGMSIVISNTCSSKQINIDISSRRSNFYMNSNILFDRPFIKFYLNKFHDIILNDNDDYTLSFIDNEMEEVIMDESHYIELYNNNYQICFNRS